MFSGRNRRMLSAAGSVLDVLDVVVFLFRVFHRALAFLFTFI